MNIFKSFYFSLPKKRSQNRPKISAPAPDKILNRLRLQLNILSSVRLCLPNTGYWENFLLGTSFVRFWIKQKKDLEKKKISLTK